jgi:hypothetical protein
VLPSFSWFVALRGAISFVFRDVQSL